jgi:hypothetical protein
MAEPIIEKKKEETEEMDITQPVEENADEILANQEAESPTMEEPVAEVNPELTFPTPSKKTRRAKCPPGCIRKPKCSSTGGKRSKKSKKTKGGKISKKNVKGGRKSRKSKK